MMKIETIKEKLENMLTPKRYQHSLNTAECAKKVAKVYGVDENKAYLAGLVHDTAKCLTKEEQDYYINKYNVDLDKYEDNNIALSHSKIGAYMAKNEFEINDEDIIESIKYHTTGKANMDILEKIVYMADIIEVGRNYDGVDELRELTMSGNINEALLISFDYSIEKMLKKKKTIHPTTVHARNYYLEKENIKSKKEN